MTDEKEDPIEDDLPFIRSQDVRDLLNSSGSLSFKHLVIDVYDKLKKRRWLDVKKVRDEIDSIESISINAKDFRGSDTDFRTFGKLIITLDGYRSRLSDILSDAQNDYDAIDAWNKELREIWISKSVGKSSDKREGEATEILVFLTHERIIRKALLNTVKFKFSLMTAKLDSLSREITIGQELRRNTV